MGKDELEFKLTNKRAKKAMARAKLCVLDVVYSELETPGVKKKYLKLQRS